MQANKLILSTLSFIVLAFTFYYFLFYHYLSAEEKTCGLFASFHKGNDHLSEGINLWNEYHLVSRGDKVEQLSLPFDSFLPGTMLKVCFLAAGVENINIEFIKVSLDISDKKTSSSLKQMTLESQRSRDSKGVQKTIKYDVRNLKWIQTPFETVEITSEKICGKNQFLFGRFLFGRSPGASCTDSDLINFLVNIEAKNLITDTSIDSFIYQLGSAMSVILYFLEHLQESSKEFLKWSGQENLGYSQEGISPAEWLVACVGLPGIMDRKNCEGDQFSFLPDKENIDFFRNQFYLAEEKFHKELRLLVSYKKNLIHHRKKLFLDPILKNLNKKLK